MAKSYKQLYEEQKITEDEVKALKVVAHGCNKNVFLRHREHEGVRFEDALKTVYALIERVSE